MDFMFTLGPLLSSLPNIDLLGKTVTAQVENSVGDLFDGFNGDVNPPAELLVETVQLQPHQISITPNPKEYLWRRLRSTLGAKEIRLVEISKAISSQHELVERLTIPTTASYPSITCTVSHHRLEEAPPYDAVSYTWLNYARDIPVTVDTDGYINVNASLYACLLRLLDKRDHLTLWWDQICVDQTQTDDGLKEKNEQVMLMNEIFARAQKTIVWLGETDAESDEAIATLEQIMPSVVSPKNGDLARAAAKEVAKHGFDEKTKKSTKQRLAIGRLLNRPWFSRAWIYQEAAMAKDAVIMVGYHEIAFEHFAMAAQAYCDAEQDIVRNAASSLTNQTRGYSILKAILYGQQERQQDSKPGSTRQLQALLCRLAGAVQATVPHDLVYAFLAFQDRAKPVLHPKYQLPVSDAYKDVARVLMKETQSLDIFGVCGGSSEGIPTWTPDWRIRLPQGHPIYRAGVESVFQACKHPYEELQSSPALLKVKGHIIAQVTALGPDAFDVENRNKGQTNRYLKLESHLKFMTNTSEGGTKPDPDGDFLPAEKARMLRILLADGVFAFSLLQKHEGLTDEKLDQYLKVYTEEVKLLHSENSKMQQDREELREKMMICVQKRVFCCKLKNELKFGLAPSGIKVGDCIALLHGSRVPVVLKNAEGSNDGLYQLVGQCYLEGAMSGKLVDWSLDGGSTLLLR